MWTSAPGMSPTTSSCPPTHLLPQATSPTYPHAVVRTFKAPRLAPALADLVDPVLADETSWDGVQVRGDLGEAAAARVELAGSRLIDVRLTGAQLPGLRLRDCVLERCELSGANLEEAGLDRCELIDCRLSGAVLSAARLRHVRFVGCRMDGVNLRLATGTGVRFDHCELTNADFYAAQLSDGEVLDCALAGADFSQADLAGTEMYGSGLAAVVGSHSLRGVTIDAGQVLSLALAMFPALGITVGDRPTPD